jgi:hypothetical protein
MRVSKQLERFVGPFDLTPYHLSQGRLQITAPHGRLQLGGHT